MTPEDALEIARNGDLDLLGRERTAVSSGVRVFARRGDASSALELFGRAWRIWLASGELDEGRDTATAALAATGGDDVPIWRARALYGDGVLAFRSGDSERSLRRNEEALRVAQDAGDARGECEALTGLARLALRDGRYDDVAALAGHGRELARDARDREAEASPLHLQAAGVRLQKDYAAARELYLQSFALNGELGNDAGQTMELDCLGWVELHLGNVDEAETRFRERDSRLGSDPYANAWSRLTWAAVAAARGDGDEARRRYDEATEALRELSNELDPDDQAELDWLGERLAALGV
jgi:tetratricopeptide (TPR) repeat protein